MALSTAARRPQARGALDTELDSKRWLTHPTELRVHILRAFGDELAQLKNASVAFEAVSKSDDVAIRFRLMAPAAVLAVHGSAAARRFLEDGLEDPQSAFLRTEAARQAALVGALSESLARSTMDLEPRVREAACMSLGKNPASSTSATVALLERLAHDTWTFVRAAAARALGQLSVGRNADQSLALALHDPAPHVREEAIAALNAHNAKAHMDDIRSRAWDPAEVSGVRVRAFETLAAWCDKDSVERWLTLARPSQGSHLDPELLRAAFRAAMRVDPARTQKMIQTLPAEIRAQLRRLSPVEPCGSI